MRVTWAALNDATPLQGRWVDLPPTGWGAMIALLAGPGRGRAVAFQGGEAKVVHSHPDGTEEVWYEGLTDEDLIGIGLGAADYLARHGLPAPPSGTGWQVRVPDGLTLDTLLRAISAAQMAVPQEDLAGERSAMEAVLKRLLPSRDA